MNNVGHARPKAEGFPLAPLIEAVVDVNFLPALSEEELEHAREALSAYYPTFTATPFHEFRIDAEAASVEVIPARKHFQGIGKDSTELSLLRPDGIGSSQLAPYREWDDLYGRFKRDLDCLVKATGPKKLVRMAVRSINRIDVPPSGNLIKYEDYLTVYPHVPEDWTTISDFQVQLVKDIEPLSAAAKIVVKRHPPSVEGCVSFFLDIDLSRVDDLPEAGPALDLLFAEFRAAKNEIYRASLTPMALKEFEQ